MNSHLDHIIIPWSKILIALLVIIIVGLALDWLYAGEHFFLYKFWQSLGTKQ